MPSFSVLLNFVTSYSLYEVINGKGSAKDPFDLH